MDAVLRFLKEQCGAKHIGAVGFCWGGVAVHYLALQYPEVKAGVSVYGMALHIICVAKSALPDSITVSRQQSVFTEYNILITEPGTDGKRPLTSKNPPHAVLVAVQWFYDGFYVILCRDRP